MDLHVPLSIEDQKRSRDYPRAFPQPRGLSDDDGLWDLATWRCAAITNCRSPLAPEGILAALGSCAAVPLAPGQPGRPTNALARHASCYQFLCCCGLRTGGQLRCIAAYLLQYI